MLLGDKINEERLKRNSAKVSLLRVYGEKSPVVKQTLARWKIQRVRDPETRHSAKAGSFRCTERRSMALLVSRTQTRK